MPLCSLGPRMRILIVEEDEGSSSFEKQQPLSVEKPCSLTRALMMMIQTTLITVEVWSVQQHAVSGQNMLPDQNPHLLKARRKIKMYVEYAVFIDYYM